jgi:hypothetical protein
MGRCISLSHKNREEFQNSDLVEVWKTPLSYPQNSSTLAHRNTGVAFSTTSKTIAAHARPG